MSVGYIQSLFMTLQAFGSLAAPAFLLGVVAAFFRPNPRKKGLKGKPREGFNIVPELVEV